METKPILLGLKGKNLYPDEIHGKRIKKGDKVALIPIDAFIN